MTIKQTTAIANIVENGGNVTKGMRDAGYKEGSINNPKSLTESKAWQEVFEKHLPDEKLFTKHNEALDATKWNDFTGEREEDHAIRLKAVELGYKLKHRLQPELNVQGDLNMIVNIVRHEGS